LSILLSNPTTYKTTNEVYIIIISRKGKLLSNGKLSYHSITELIINPKERVPKALAKAVRLNAIPFDFP